MEIIVGSPEMCVQYEDVWIKKKCYKCKGDVFLSDKFTTDKKNVRYMCGHCFLHEKIKGEIIISDETVEKLGASKEFLSDLLNDIRDEHEKNDFGGNN
jgi:ribosomal protein S27AE